jgi:uncharacterized protein
MTNEPPQLTQSQFLTSAALFEGGLLLVALVCGWLAGISPVETVTWSWEDFGLGLLAAVPMLLVLSVCMLSRAKGFVQIREFLRDFIGPFLDRCHWYDLVLLALLAGVCEEIFFRGFLYLWIAGWNLVLAVILTNLLFGVAHAVTPLYALLAAFLGIYLTALLAADPTPNLLIPVTAHSVYDLIGLLIVLWDYRRFEGSGKP